MSFGKGYAPIISAAGKPIQYTKHRVVDNITKIVAPSVKLSSTCISNIEHFTSIYVLSKYTRNQIQLTELYTQSQLVSTLKY